MLHFKINKRLFTRGKVSVRRVFRRLELVIGMDFLFLLVYVGAEPVFQSFSHVEWDYVICVRILSFCPLTGSGELFQCLIYGAGLLFHHIVFIA